MRTLVTNSVAETLALGERLGRLLAPGDFVALIGELGAGKTHFVQGVARGLGIDPALPVTSPTYTLLHEYRGRIPLYHFDLYRLEDVEEIIDLGFEDYFFNSGSGACVVEWADRADDYWPSEHLTISMKMMSETKRGLLFVASGEHYCELLRQFQKNTYAVVGN